MAIVGVFKTNNKAVGLNETIANIYSHTWSKLNYCNGYE